MGFTNFLAGCRPKSTGGEPDPLIGDVLLWIGGDTINDLSTNNRTVSEQFGTVNKDNSSPLFGSESFSFPTGGGILRLPDRLGVTNVSQVTVDLWVYFDSLLDSVERPMYQWEYNNINGNEAGTYSLMYVASTSSWHVRTGGWRELTSDIPLGQWNHIAIAFIGNRFRVWINGVLEPEINFASLNLEWGYLAVGAGYDLNRRLQGKIESFRVTSGQRFALANFDPVADTYSDYTLI